ncbi:MAG: nuclear transport factor 2 family protein [Deltaproteobacteria bacterium]|nr:nuclear transport factor 2 family protein [Deltaproteobacteria bacterium]
MIGAVIMQRKVRSAFDCLNRRDLPAFLLNWAEEATFIYPSTVSVGGKIEGKNAVAKWFQGFMEQFPKVKFTVKNVCVQNILSFGGTNVAAVEWDCTGINRDGMDFHNSGVIIINAKEGQVVWAREYIFDAEMLKLAWGESGGK